MAILSELFFLDQPTLAINLSADCALLIFVYKYIFLALYPVFFPFRFTSDRGEETRGSIVM